MLQQLGGETGAGAAAIASMLFFLGFWTVVAVRTWRARPEQMKAQANLPLSDD